MFRDRSTIVLENLAEPTWTVAQPDPELTEIAARWESMCDILKGKEASDFMLSFPEVRELQDICARRHK